MKQGGFSRGGASRRLGCLLKGIATQKERLTGRRRRSGCLRGLLFVHQRSQTAQFVRRQGYPTGVLRGNWRTEQSRTDAVDLEQRQRRLTTAQSALQQLIGNLQRLTRGHATWLDHIGRQGGQNVFHRETRAGHGDGGGKRAGPVVTGTIAVRRCGRSQKHVLGGVRAGLIPFLERVSPLMSLGRGRHRGASCRTVVRFVFAKEATEGKRHDAGSGRARGARVGERELSETEVEVSDYEAKYDF